MDVFRALADPVRRSLLVDLAGGPRRVVDLAVTRSISRPAVSKHLRLLLESGAVTVTDHGRERFYELDPTALAPVADYLAEVAPRRTAPITDGALHALETEVRRTTRDRRRAGPLDHDREETA